MEKKISPFLAAAVLGFAYPAEAKDLNVKKTDTDLPNVIFIYADDMGRGMLSHYGQKYIKTPNIDRIFNEGTSFSYAYGCMYSAPSRASLITGYNDCREGLWNISRGGALKTIDGVEDLARIEAAADQERIELPEGDLLLPQVFKQAGYVTGQVGKLEWGFLATRKQMHEHGWDYFCGYLDHGHAHCFYPRYLVENDDLVYLPGNTRADHGRGQEKEGARSYAMRWNMEGKVTYTQDFFNEKMISFIRENKDKPFFLFHSTNLPHGPVAIPKVHPSIKDNPDLSELEKEYASMVLKLDESVGMILDELERLGIDDHTLVIFSNDNGHETYYSTGNRCRKQPICDMNGKKFDDWDYPFNSEDAGDLFNGNDGFSGKKWMNWEGSVRVPLAFRWPGVIRAGYESDQVVANYDLLTTFADLFDVRLSTEKDGESLLPILTGGKKHLAGKRYVFVNAPEGPAVIGSDHWKLRYNHERNAYRLHNLAEDYTEEHLLNEQEPARVKKMARLLDEYIKEK